MNKLIIVVDLIIIALLLKNKSSFDETDDILSYNYTEQDKKFKNDVTTTNDIKLQPVGCFINIEDRFFFKKINPFSKIKTFDSGTVVSNQDDFNDLLNIVKNNGFGDKIKNKDYLSASIEQFATLGLYAGYSYLSITKMESSDSPKVYFTYSPPMNKHNNYGTFDDKQYQENLSKPDLPNFSVTPEVGSDGCGFSCGTFKDNGVIKNYTCGSTADPTIKSPQRVSVYKIIF